MSRGREDPRLQQALQLLAEVMRDSAGAGPGARVAPFNSAPAAGLPLGPAPPGSAPPGMAADPWQHAHQVWLTSATDLLVPWSPEAAAGIPSAPPGGAGSWHEGAVPAADWQSYFGQAGQAAEPAPDVAITSKQPIPLPIDALSFDAATRPLRDELDDLAAEAAVDALYEFVHALGRREVNAAMTWVADEFHALADDVEVDRRALRQQIEMFLEERQQGELEIHLSRVPEPVAHPLGVLLEITLHADHTVVDEVPQTTVVPAVVLMTTELKTTAGNENDGQNRWQIASLVTLETDS